MSMKFGELLTKYRERASLSKTDLAKKIGVSPGYIMNLESGRKKPPTPDRIEQLIKILSLSPIEGKGLKHLTFIEKLPSKTKDLFTQYASEIHSYISDLENMIQERKDNYAIQISRIEESIAIINKIRKGHTTEEQKGKLKEILQYFQSDLERLQTKLKKTREATLLIAEMKGKMNVLYPQSDYLFPETKKVPSEVIVPEPEEPKEKPEMLRIPILGECPAGTINWFGDEEHAEDWVEIPFYLVKDRDVYALRARGSCLKEVGILDNDIVIVAKHRQLKNGDIVVVRIDNNEVTMKRFFQKDKLIVLEPANDDYKPIILDPKDKKVEIIGKVIRALKIFD